MLHFPAPPVGSVEVITSALLLTAAQACSSTQSKAVSCNGAGAGVETNAAGSALGLIEVRIDPRLPVRQNVEPVHLTPISSPNAGSCRTCHAAGPPVGSLELSTTPSAPTTRHWVGLEQETPCSSRSAGSWVVVQAVGPPPGSAEVRILQPSTTATQRPVVGHEMP